MPQTFIPTLHYLSHSGAFRCLWALEELKEAKGIEYKLKTYERKMGQAPPSLAEVFPMGKSPIITLETTDPKVALPTIQLVPGVITEGMLILRYLNEEFGEGMWTPASEDKHRNEFFQVFANNSLMSQLSLILLPESIIAVCPMGISALLGLLLSPLTSMFKARLQPAFKLLDDELEHKPWFAGAKFGVADIDMSFSMDIASERGYINFEKYPRLRDWHKSINSRPSYSRALKLCNGYNMKTFGV
ncbi:hypothetical protein F5Y18DRAFT_297517 [Xylariaceae sp. FL1019]|nr:hypothetical protein F5Y18DRAFT_297517 [Xylariaceae sp. FL1019]